MCAKIYNYSFKKIINVFSKKYFVYFAVDIIFINDFGSDRSGFLDMLFV